MFWLYGLAAMAACVSAWFWTSLQQQAITMDQLTSPQAVFLDPRSFAVMGSGADFRGEAFKAHFNPTNLTPPLIQIFHPDFLSILGTSPSLRTIASIPGIPFAHEAPIWHPERDEVFFSSHCGADLGWEPCDRNNHISKIEMKDVDAALQASSSMTSPVNVTVTKLDIPDSRQMTWGGTGPYNSSLLLINSGRDKLPSSLALVNPAPPYNVTILLDNYYGRQFNSLNDGKIHPKSHAIFFTDVTYGFLKHFRPTPQLPNQIYRFDPDTGDLRVVADGLLKPNGLAFSGDGSIAYVADTGAAQGFLGRNQTGPATIYAFDVDPVSQTFLNRRVFAYIDAGVPDGIQVDIKGNVYSGCGDGVHVWNRNGVLLGKFFIGSVACNMVFAGAGKLVILAQTAIYVARIASEGIKLAFP